MRSSTWARNGAKPLPCATEHLDNRALGVEHLTPSRARVRRASTPSPATRGPRVSAAVACACCAPSSSPGVLAALPARGWSQAPPRCHGRRDDDGAACHALRHKYCRRVTTAAALCSDSGSVHHPRRGAGSACLGCGLPSRGMARRCLHERRRLPPGDLAQACRSSPAQDHTQCERRAARACGRGCGWRARAGHSMHHAEQARGIRAVESAIGLARQHRRSPRLGQLDGRCRGQGAPPRCVLCPSGAATHGLSWMLKVAITLPSGLSRGAAPSAGRRCGHRRQRYMLALWCALLVPQRGRCGEGRCACDRSRRPPLARSQRKGDP
eukprot:scaffold2437_cov395-Prasinococcus_capsulatus_cf.AAC.22